MMAFPNGNIAPERLTVVSWVLPQTKATKMETRKEKTYPPESWARARFYGEVVNEKLRRYVLGELKKEGIRAAAPTTAAPVVADGFGQVRLCLEVVRAPRRLRLGSGDLRALRRPHHSPGEGHAGRVGRRRDPRYPRHPGLTRGTRTTACGSATGPARSAWSDVPWRPSPRRGTTRSPARSTSTRPARAISWSTSASRAMPAASARRGFPASRRSLLRRKGSRRRPGLALAGHQGLGEGGQGAADRALQKGNGHSAVCHRHARFAGLSQAAEHLAAVQHAAVAVDDQLEVRQILGVVPPRKGLDLDLPPAY